MQHILNRWIRYVESTGNEVGMTLLVGGTTISGILTPVRRYADWLAEVMNRADHEGGEMSLPTIEMPEITEQQSQRARDDWGEGGLTPGGESLDDPVRERGPGCVLRNAEVRPPGPKTYWQTYPYLLIQINSVDAILPVMTSGKHATV